MSASDPAESKRPAAWEPDPLGRAPYRWWDGEKWTEHVGRADGDYWIDEYGAKPTAPALVHVDSPSGSGIRGALARRKSKRSASERDRQLLRDEVAKAARGDSSARVVDVLERTRAAWKEKELRRFADDTFLSLAEEFLADDVLTQDEQNRLLGIARDLGLSQELIRKRHRSTFEDIVIAGVNDGRLPVLPKAAVHIVAKGTETVHAEWPAQLMKEVAIREFRGGSSGVSIPLGFGVRYRTSSVRGRSVVVGQQLVPEDAGVFAVTSTRSVFVGNKKTLEFRHDKLIGLQQFSDGLRLNVSNRQRASLIKIPASESPLLAGALITAAASAQ